MGRWVFMEFTLEVPVESVVGVGSAGGRRADSGGPARGRRCRRTRFHPLAGRVGVTLLDVILILVIVGTLTTLSVPAFRALSNDLAGAVTETAGFVTQARSQAMSTTSAVRLRVVSETELVGERNRACSEAAGWETEGRVRVLYREGITVSGVQVDDILLCFDSRGVSDGNPTLTLTDRAGRSREIEILLGGGIVDRIPGGDE